MLTALTNGTICTGNEIINGKAILIEKERIKAIIDNDSIPDNTEVIDCNSYYIAPGLIDLQIAGAGGYLFSADPSAEALKVITESILQSGTTGFLIVLPTNSTDVYLEALRTVRSNPHPAILGLHLEGPYISKAKRGAHMIDHIKLPDRKGIETLLIEAAGVIKMITLAPEVCDQETIKLIRKYGVVVCAGHSNATFKEAVDGFSWGIKATTHLFNAMSQLHHRDPGLPGATFQTEGILASIVADGIHVDYNTISIAKKVMKERLYLISDAVEASFQSACHHVRQKDRFTLPDGTLSGSLLTMMKAVENCVKHVNIPLDEALRMATSYPAKLMNLADRGKIEPGLKADVIAFDKEYNIKQVCNHGVYVRL
jgi:N-acetylglucosamine-6-phosphate deacetylase